MSKLNTGSVEGRRDVSEEGRTYCLQSPEQSAALPVRKAFARSGPLLQRTHAPRRCPGVTWTAQAPVLVCVSDRNGARVHFSLSTCRNHTRVHTTRVRLLVHCTCDALSGVNRPRSRVSSGAPCVGGCATGEPRKPVLGCTHRRAPLCLRSLPLRQPLQTSSCGA